MSKINIALSDLHAAYEQWIGTPNAILELRRQESNEQIPSEMDILFFQPAAEDNLSDEEYFTYIATAGMSTRVMQGPCKHVELILCVNRRHSSEELHALGRALSELAVIPFCEGTYFAPNLLVCDVLLPLFENMNCVLITNWGTYLPEWLPGIKPPVQLLCVRAIYESEADIIEKIGDIEAIRRFTNESIKLDDPKRLPAYLRKLSDATESKKLNEQIELTDVEIAIQNIWHEIEAWYMKNAPRLLEDLKGGVSDQQINDFEAVIEMSLPDDYKASLKLHNGDVYFHDYEYLNLECVLNKWLIMTRLNEDDTFKDRKPIDTAGGIIQNTWWHRGWIPFAEDGGGNLICIDKAPGVNGVPGQMLYMELQSGPCVSKHKSFLEWIGHYKDDLYRGVYELDEDGCLVEKID